MSKNIKKRYIDFLLLKQSKRYANLNIFLKKMLFPIIGFAALIWFLIRVIPKPSRVTYPCVQAAAPLASSFILFLLGMGTSVSAFKKAQQFLRNSRYLAATIMCVICLLIGSFSFLHYNKNVSANQNLIYEFNDPLGPNNPIGEAKGIFPGRVVWVYNPDATNENCTNSNLNDAYFLEKNTDQAVVDSMFSEGILALTGTKTHQAAWDAIFRHFNVEHGKGNVGYKPTEKVFIKINAVSAWSGIGSNGEMKNLPNDSDTTPQAILTMLRQLINEAGVTEENIYIGDPIAGIWNHLYNKFAAEFPNVNYMDVDGKVAGRSKLVEYSGPVIIYSDKGAVLNNDPSFSGKHHLYQSMVNADYLINIPSMKGHRWGGVTLFAKNHFGSNTSGTSWQLHAGLMNNDNKGAIRTGYKKYRVLVDLMGGKHLGGKTLIYFMDGLWSTSYEHQLPQKFQSAPFNNDWSSSLLLSLDPVAIESVCLNILQKEFTTEDLNAKPVRYTYVQWDGIDDYLHQAASNEWWPDGIIYDPDDSGTPISSLGTHEHWNNTESMQYSRNLDPVAGQGIELVTIFNIMSAVSNADFNNPVKYNLAQNYPNPFNPRTTISFQLEKSDNMRLEIFNANGQRVDVLVDAFLNSGEHHIKWDGCRYASGIYYYRLSSSAYTTTRKMLMLK